MIALKDCPTLSDYIARTQVDGVLWKAEKLLANVDNPLIINERIADICRTIALLPASKQVVKDIYITKICKEYKLSPKTLQKYVADHTVIEGKKKEIVRAVRKNTVTKLDGDQKTFPFFTELVNSKTREFKGLKIDTLKYVQLLSSFGFTRYTSDSDAKDGYTFVRLIENVINEVNKEEIIDFIEHFIKTQYDFNAAGCDHVDADMLINTFYDNIKKYFSKDLFARVRIDAPIIINRDTLTECFLYFKNGFVRVTKEGYDLNTYDKMEGSVWQKQMLDRSFIKEELQFTEKQIPGETEEERIDWENSFSLERPLGDYADFIWRICGQKQQRFISLCSILGYLLHDYYDYKLKCIFLTDSAVTEQSDGRTGKTLSMQLLGYSRSYCEINGKQFDQNNERKYETADRSTQILHINDLNHKGKFKFDFEMMFNDITEGYMIRQMFKSPFRQRSKTVISSNKSMNIQGSSMRDRILEFEVSSFFSESRSPFTYYGKWMGKGWNESDWQKFDNFLCFCAQCFLTHGLIPPDTINLEARKLLDSTSREFLEFMGDIKDYLLNHTEPWEGYGTQTDFTTTFTDSKAEVSPFENFVFDKRKLFERFIIQYPDFKSNHFTHKRFHAWLMLYARLGMQINTPTEKRSNGVSYIQFKETVTT